MKERDFISVIKNILNSEYIGDDCAYLKDLGIVITQDSLVEDVHFLKKYITPYQLGYKSVMVNISDVAASGAEAEYLTISLSLPSDIDEDFIKEFYNGAKSACGKDIKIVGGDITGSGKIFISICVVGSTSGRNISSRKNAQIGQKIILSGKHGSSGAGLKLLLEGKKSPEKFIKSHLEPVAQIDFGLSHNTYSLVGSGSLESPVTGRACRMYRIFSLMANSTSWYTPDAFLSLSSSLSNCRKI